MTPAVCPRPADETHGGAPCRSPLGGLHVGRLVNWSRFMQMPPFSMVVEM